MPIEEDVEIISNCDLMDLRDTVATSDISSSTHEPSQSLTMHTSLETVEKSRPTNTSDVEFVPVNNTLPLNREDIDSHRSKPSRRRLLNIVLFLDLALELKIIKRFVCMYVCICVCACVCVCVCVCACVCMCVCVCVHMFM